LPSLTARLRSARAHWVAKLTGEQRPWMKLVVEHRVDWTKQEALSSVREIHGVEGFLRECVTAWYDSLKHVFLYIFRPSDIGNITRSHKDKRGILIIVLFLERL
jgi:hypothetical protein